MSAGFERRDGELRCDGVSLTELAREFGTPLYVYSWPRIEEAYRRFDTAFASVPHLVCYAAKANSSLAILKRLAALGAGADVVSGGELRARSSPDSRPSGSSSRESARPTRRSRRRRPSGILAFNAESEREIERIGAAARALGKTARVALRVNPDIDARSHPYISTGLKQNKFGVDISRARAIFEKAKGIPGVSMTGVQAHIGSQILEAEPLVETARALSSLARELRARAFRSRPSTSAAESASGRAGSRPRPTPGRCFRPSAAFRGAFSSSRGARSSDRRARF